MRRSHILSSLISAGIASFTTSVEASCVALPGTARGLPVAGELKLDVCEPPAHSSLKGTPLVGYGSPSFSGEVTGKAPSSWQSLQDARQTVAIDKFGLVKNFNQGKQGHVSYQLRLRGNGDMKAQVRVLFD